MVNFELIDHGGGTITLEAKADGHTAIEERLARDIVAFFESKMDSYSTTIKEGRK
jgi:hypothetical protein